MEHHRSTSLFPRTRARINSAALEFNVRRIQELCRSAGIIAVVKDNAYGHGIRIVSKTLSKYVRGFAVATVDEAVELRDLGEKKPIWIFGGFKDQTELECIIDNRLVPVVHSEYQLDLLRAGNCRPEVVLELDSGMGRLGFHPATFKCLYEKAATYSDIQAVMSHFSCAEEAESEITRRQFDCFLCSIPDKSAPRSIANSAGIIGRAEWQLELVRPGLLLYGVSPYSQKHGADHGVIPAMTLESELIAIRSMNQGERIGYGGTWTCPQDMSVGVVSCGYGDGYPRSIPNGAEVELRGTRAAIVGRISMDSMTVDLRSVPEARVGDKVTLWGPGLPIESVAKQAETIPNQLLVNVMPRVPRIVEELDVGSS